MGSRVLQHSFIGGEISPAMLGRTDNPVYRNGAQRVRNFIVTPQGTLLTRPGFQFVSEAKDSSYPVRLIPFRFASDQTLVLVFGNFTMRIVTQGKQLLDSRNRVYEIETIYAADDLFNIDYCQNADIITFTCNSYPPMELRRYGATDWRWQEVTTAAQIDPPEEITLTATYPNGTRDDDKDTITARYVVTAVDKNGQESVASASASVKCNYHLTGGTVTVSWPSVEGAERYRVYRDVCGVLGFIGETTSTTVTDEGDNPDTTYTPPLYSEPFRGAKGSILSIDVLDGGSGYYPQGEGGGGMSLPEKLRFGGFAQCVIAGAITLDYREGCTIDMVPQYLKMKLRIYDGSQQVSEIELPLTIAGSRMSYYTLDRDGGYIWRFFIVYTVSVTADGYTLDLSTFEHTFTGTPSFKITIEDTGDHDIGWGISHPHPGSDSQSIPLSECMENDSFRRNYEFQEQLTDDEKALWSRLFGGSGLTLEEFLTLFPQDMGTYEIPLVITDSTGTGAKATAIATGGKVIAARVDAQGRDYTSPSVRTDTTVGSGAVFDAVIADENEWEYPSANTQYDQRRIFGGSNQNPLKVWMTNAGKQDLMMYHQPVMPDDRIEIVAVTADADRIRHAVALDSLILFTSSSELRVFTQNSDALAPDSVAVRAQSYNGANACQPVISGSHIVYAAARGGHVRTLSFSYTVNGYASADVSLIASHLFDGYAIKDITLMKAPHNVVWFASSSGKLLGLTFLPDQNVAAWHQHDTDGQFESVCCVSEGDEDRLYAVVRRQVGGTWKRYIERMGTFRTVSRSASRQLDGYIASEGNAPAASGTFTGLSHLEGKTVTVFADGVAHEGYTVKNGKVTGAPVGAVTAVGLPFTSTLITVPVTAEVQGSMQGTLKNISEIFLRVAGEGDAWANVWPSERLRPVQRNAPQMEPQGDETRLVKVTADGRWDYQGQLEIEHRDALPLEIMAVVGNITVERGS